MMPVDHLTMHLVWIKPPCPLINMMKVPRLQLPLERTISVPADKDIQCILAKCLRLGMPWLRCVVCNDCLLGGRAELEVAAAFS